MNDLETTNNDILSGNAFDTIFTYFCYQNKIKYKSLKLPFRKKGSIVAHLLKKYNFYFSLKEFNFYSIKIRFKKILSNFFFAKVKKENLVFEPAYDINYTNISLRKSFYIDIEKNFLKKHKK